MPLPKWLQSELQGTGETKAAYTGCTPHSVGHLLITSQCLYPKTNSLQLSTHLIEALDISACPHKVLCHDFAGILVF